VRRFVFRRNRGDDGLSLIETVAALVVFALVMSGLAAGMALFAHTTALTKVRNSATAMAQQIMESAKTIPVNQLVICTGGGADGQKFTYQSQQYDILVGTTPCLPYTSTRTGNGVTFTIQQVIFEYQHDTVNNQPITDKMLVVTVTWSQPSSGSYRTHTMISGKNSLASQTPVGLRINVNDGSNNLITSADLVWDYTVSNASGVVLSGTTDDGTSGLLSLSPGGYTCSVTPEEDAGASYDPSSTANGSLVITPTTETISGSCTVPASSIGDWNTVWNEVTDCASSTTQKATSVSVTVYDKSNNLVNGATVYLTNVGTGANAGQNSANVTTGANGVATFSGGNAPLADVYSYTISKAGYETFVGGPVCIAPGVATSTLTGNIKSLSTCTVSKTLKGTVTVTVQDTADPANTVSGARITLANQDGNGSPGAQNSGSDGTYTFTNVLAGNYTVTVTKTGYTNLGAQGPYCVAGGTGAQTPIPATLPSQGSSGCTSTTSKGPLQVKVVDGNNQPIDNVKVTLTNANGHNGTPGAKTTDPTGIVLWSGGSAVPGDLFTYTVTVPAGYSNPGTQGPICVKAGTTLNESSVTLVGIMTAKVTVQNKDT